MQGRRRPQRADIFGKKYLFSGYQPCLICIRLTCGDNGKCKKLSEVMPYSDAVSFPLPLRSGRRSPWNSPIRTGAPWCIALSMLWGARRSSRVSMSPPTGVGCAWLQAFTCYEPWRNNVSRFVTVSKSLSHEHEVDHISTADTEPCTVKQLGKKTHASSPRQGQTCSIFCKSLVLLWVKEIIVAN